MTVRSVTPRIIAISGHVQFYRDADFFDADQDERAVGDIFDPEWPDKPLRLRRTSSHRASDARPAPGSASSTDPMNAPGAAEGGRDTRLPGATSSKSSALGGPGAGTPRNPAAGALGGPRVTPGTGTSSSAGAGPRATTDVSSARREPGAA